MDNVRRAYSLFDVKSLDASKRVFSGMATTPTPDRVRDIVRPGGVQFKNPLPLLHQHNHNAPIGLVQFGRPTSKGIPFEAEIPLIEEEGSLKDRVDTAWGEIRHGLVRAVSIGFRPIKWSYMEDGGIDFEETEVYELSAVSIPANPDAVISAVKSMPDRLSDDIIKQLMAGDRNAPVQLISRVALPRDMQAAIPLIQIPKE